MGQVVPDVVGQTLVGELVEGSVIPTSHVEAQAKSMRYWKALQCFFMTIFSNSSSAWVAMSSVQNLSQLFSQNGLGSILPSIMGSEY